MDKRSLLNALTVENVWGLVVVDNPSTIEPDAPLAELLQRMVDDTRTRHVYVVDEQRHLVGVVRMTTVIGLLFPMQALGAEISEPHLFHPVSLGGQTVRDVMNNEPRWVRTDTGLQDMARVLLEEKITELPVVDKAKRLIGQVSMYEIIKAYLQLRQE
jgi:CBS-domain-containing membrane protein